MGSSITSTAAWIGSELSFAVIDAGWDGLPAMAGTVAVRDREAAEDFIDDLRGLLVDTSYSFVEFDEDDYGEFETWVAEDSYGTALFASNPPRIHTRPRTC